MVDKPEIKAISGKYSIRKDLILFFMNYFEMMICFHPHENMAELPK